jgi:hypothetical protein
LKPHNSSRANVYHRLESESTWTTTETVSEVADVLSHERSESTQTVFVAIVTGSVARAPLPTVFAERYGSIIPGDRKGVIAKKAVCWRHCKSDDLQVRLQNLIANIKERIQ